MSATLWVISLQVVTAISWVILLLDFCSERDYIVWMKVVTHKDLEVWKDSMDLAVRVYELTSKFPKREIYGLSDQLRRSAYSVPSNIAEGAGRKGTKEFIRFLDIATGSLAECETQLLLSIRVGILREDDMNLDKILKLQKGLRALKYSLSRKLNASNS